MNYMRKYDHPTIGDKSRQPSQQLQKLVFLGFNSRVAALHRDTGELLWKWKSPKGSGFPSLLLEQDRLFVSVNGYMYALDPSTGEQLWANPMKKMGFGTACLVSINGIASGNSSASAEITAQQHAAAAC